MNLCTSQDFKTQQYIFLTNFFLILVLNAIFPMKSIMMGQGDCETSLKFSREKLVGFVKQTLLNFRLKNQILPYFVCKLLFLEKDTIEDIIEN